MKRQDVTIKDIMKDVYNNFEEITGRNPNGAINLYDNEMSFDQNFIDKTHPKIKKYVMNKYGVDITKEAEEFLYELDDKILNEYWKTH